MATYTWISDVAGDWTTTENWDTDDGSPTYPGADDAAIFNGDHTGDCDVNAEIEVGSISDSGSYSGDLSLSNALTVSGESGFSWTNGEISGAAQLTVYRDCNIAGATISTDAGQLIQIKHDRVLTNTFTADQTISNLEFTYTLGGYQSYVLSGTFTVSGDVTLTNVSITGTAEVTVQDDLVINTNNTASINSAGITFNVEGDLYLTDGSFDNGTIVLDGDIVAGNDWNGGKGIIEWQKAGNETWTPNANIMYPTMKFTSARTVTLGGTLYCYDIHVPAGSTLDTDDNAIRFQTFNVDNISGTFTIGDSSIRWSPILVNALSCNLGTMTVSSLAVTDGYSIGSDHALQGNCSIGTLIINTNARLTNTSGTPTVTDELQLLDGVFRVGTIDLEGDLVISPTATDTSSGSGTINWTQTGDINWSDTGGGTGIAPIINFNSDRTITLQDDIKAIGYAFTQGILDVSTDNHSIEALSYWNASAANSGNPCLNARAGTITLMVTINKTYVGAADADGLPMYNLNMVPGSGNASYVTNTFNGYWNVSNDIHCRFSGEMKLSNGMVVNVGGDADIENVSSLSIRSNTSAVVEWNIAGDLWMHTGVLWKFWNGTSLTINVQGDVDLDQCLWGTGYSLGTITIVLNGTGAQSFDADALCVVPYVTIDKSSETATIINGGVTFYDIDVVQGNLVFSEDNTYHFNDGNTVTVANGATMTFLGTSDSAKITLREIGGGSDTWNIDNQSGSTVEAYFTDVKGSVASNEWVITYDCTNSGGNVNWLFPAGGRDGTIDAPIIDSVFIDIPMVKR